MPDYGFLAPSRNMRRSTMRRTALCVSMLSITAICAILSATTQVEAAAVAGVALPSVPAPWVAVAASIQFATSINWYIKMFKLFLQLVTGGGRDAACNLCDEVVTVMLELDDTKDSLDLEGESLCDNICPFKIQRCVDLCSKLLDAIQSSTKFPCEAIGVCEELDEFGEEPECKFSWASGCQPATHCARSQSLPFPKCDLKPGKKKWKRVTKAMTENVGALAAAVQSLPKCGEPGAHEVFCVDEPTGIHLFAEYAGYVLIFVVATAKSVAAIESTGGDDDRQWLSFWMIFFLFTCVERFTDVILSKFPIYYECKLLVLIYLIIFDGASGLYFYVHSFVRLLQRNFIARHVLQLLASLTFEASDTPDEVQTYIERRLAEKEDDEKRAKLSHAAVERAQALLEKSGRKLEGKRVDAFEAEWAGRLRGEAEECAAALEAALAHAKLLQRRGGSREEVNKLLKRKSELRTLLPASSPNLKSQAPPEKADSEKFVKQKKEVEAAMEKLKGTEKEVQAIRALMMKGLERANYEFIMANLRAPGRPRTALQRVFTDPICGGVWLLRVFLVPLEKMAFKLMRKGSVGDVKAQAVLEKKSGLPDVPAGLTPETLQGVIDKTQDVDWKALEVRYLEVQLQEVNNVPPMDTDGFCQPFVKLSLVQLCGQEQHIGLAWKKGDAPGESLPKRLLTIDLAGDGTKKFKEYSHTVSKVSRKPKEQEGKPWSSLFQDEKLELPVEGGAINDKGEYENKAAPYHVLLGELYDKDTWSPSDLAGFFQVPCAILMDGLKHQVEVELELTATAMDSIKVGAKHHADKKRYNSDKPVTVKLALQFTS